MKNPIRKCWHLGLYLSYLVCIASDNCRAQEVNIDRETDRIEATQLRFGLDANQPLIKRVGKTPESVLAIFHEAGMSPKPYTLYEQDQQRLVEAISILPPIHQSVLKQRLRLQIADNEAQSIAACLSKELLVSLCCISLKSWQQPCYNRM